MSGQKFLINNSGVITEVAATQVGGSDSAGLIPSLDASGKLATTMLPTGVGPDTVSLPASEALAAGAFINIWSNSGSANVRNADCSGASAGKIAHGFVLEAVASGGAATVYLEGDNTSVTGLTIGQQFLSSVGTASTSAPTTSGYAVQRLGIAYNATAMHFQPSQPVILA